MNLLQKLLPAKQIHKYSSYTLHYGQLTLFKEVAKMHTNIDYYYMRAECLHAWLCELREHYGFFFFFFFIDKSTLSQWAWFSMSIKNFIGFSQNSAHPLRDDKW